MKKILKHGDSLVISSGWFATTPYYYFAEENEPPFLESLSSANPSPNSESILNYCLDNIIERHGITTHSHRFNTDSSFGVYWNRRIINTASHDSTT